MNDCIERKKAIELIQPHVKPQTVYGEGYLQAIEHATDILELMPAADVQPVDRWISCKEKMPEDNVPVLYVFKTETGVQAVLYGWHYKIKGLGSAWHQSGCGGARCDEDVTHWQPLPEPPKDGDTNG